MGYIQEFTKMVTEERNSRTLSSPSQREGDENSVSMKSNLVSPNMSVWVL